MKIRAYRRADLEALHRIHASQGFPYEFPDLNNPLFLTKLVLVNEEKGSEASAEDEEGLHVSPPLSGQVLPASGQVVTGAALLRVTAEAYLLLDPKMGKPRERWSWLVGLQEATRQDALARGLEDVHAWLPPEIAKKFGRRLSRMGWMRDDAWTPYCKRLM
jgi:hypothetical protein